MGLRGCLKGLYDEARVGKVGQLEKPDFGALQGPLGAKNLQNCTPWWPKKAPFGPPNFGPFFGPNRANNYPVLGGPILGPLWGPNGALSGPTGPNFTYNGPFGALLGPLWGPVRAPMGPC